jgi:hypothetical protein
MVGVASDASAGDANVEVVVVAAELLHDARISA